MAQGLTVCLQCRRHGRNRFDLLVRKIPWRRKWQLTPVFLPRQSHGQRGLTGYSPWGHKESEATEHKSRQNDREQFKTQEEELSGDKESTR